MLCDEESSGKTERKVGGYRKNSRENRTHHQKKITTIFDCFVSFDKIEKKEHCLDVIKAR